MTSGDASKCKDCLKLPLSQIFRPAPRARPRKAILRGTSNGKARIDSCPMCMFAQESRQLFNAAYEIAHGQRPEPSVLTGKSEGFILATSPLSSWLTFFSTRSIPIAAPSNTSYAWFKLEGATRPGLPEPTVLVTLEDLSGSTTPLPRRRSRQELTNTKVDVVLLKEWLELTEGEQANPPLSCSQQTREGHSILLSTYFALSYVWGPKSQLTQSDFPHSLPGAKEQNPQIQIRRSLPDTLDDAIQLIADLGELYLWIDLSCVKYDDSEHFKDQISHMYHIYANTACTLVAYDAEDAFVGLAGVSRPLRLRVQPRVQTPDGAHLMATCLPDTATRNSVPCVWRSRAWCLQEKYFSTRLMYLSELETTLVAGSRSHLDVSEAVTSVRLDLPASEVSTRSLSHDNDCLMVFNELLQDYTSRLLSNAEDALRAFQGVLCALKQHTDQAFTYAIPTVDAHSALLWSVADEHVLSPRHGFPTWSWCGWYGPVRHRDYLLENELRSQRRHIAANDDTTSSHTTVQKAQLVFPTKETDGYGTHEAHTLRITSTIANCCIRKLTASREPCMLTHLDDQSRMTRHRDLGHHWTVLTPAADALTDIANNPCWPDIFTNSPHWLHFSGLEEAVLEQIASQSASTSDSTPSRTLELPAQLVLIQRWPVVRDRSGKTLHDAVGCLLVLPVVDDDHIHATVPDRRLYRRVSALLVEGRTFDALGPSAQRQIWLV